MTAPTKPTRDKDSAKLYVAATMIGLVGKRPLESLTHNELEDLESSAEVVLMAAMGQIVKREEARRERSAGHLRLAAADGELTEAGERVVRARKAARARWAR